LNVSWSYSSTSEVDGEGLHLPEGVAALLRQGAGEVVAHRRLLAEAEEEEERLHWAAEAEVHLYQVDHKVLPAPRALRAAVVVCHQLARASSEQAEEPR
jgi:hypothetical protein